MTRGTGRRWRALLGTGLLIHGTALLAAAQPADGMRLVAGRPAVTPGVPFELAVVLQPRAGWHTYWINPGDSGMAPNLRWRLPPGVRLLDVRYPLPERVEEEGLVTLGYAAEAALLARFAADAPAGDAAGLEIGVTVTWMVCREMCMPVTSEASLTLPLAAGVLAPEPADDEAAAAFVRWRARLPRTGEGWEVRAFGTPRGVALHVRPPDGAVTPADWEQVIFHPLRRGAVDLAAPQRWVAREGMWRTVLSRGPEPVRPGDVLDGVLVLPGADASGDATAARGWRLQATVQEMSHTAAGGASPRPPAVATGTGR